MNIKHTDFSKGSVAFSILQVSVPMIIAELVNLLYSMVDRIYIGHIENVGSQALTGLGICFPIISLISAFARLYGFNGGAPLCAIAQGERKEDEAKSVLYTSLMLAVITGAVLTLIVVIFIRPILFLFGASSVTYPYARDYLLIYALGSVPVLVTLTLNAFINSQGFATIGMFTVLIGAVLNIILDPVLIFIFNLGVKGAAIATVFSQTCSALFAFFFLRSKNAVVKITFKGQRLEKKRCFKIIGLGTSGFVMGATNSLVQLVCNKCALIWGGDLYVGVMTILNSVREIFSTPINGLSSGSSPVMSYNYGARNAKRVKKASNFALFATLIISSVVWLIVVIFPRQLSLLFTSEEELINAAVPALRIYFFGFIFMSFQMTGQNTFVALGKAKPAIFFSLFRKVFIVVPLTIILPYIFGINGVLIAEPISNVVGGLASYLTMRHIVFRELNQMEKEFK